MPLEVSRAEISRGAATSVFGDRAMSGAIGIFSRPAAKLNLFAEYDTGNERTHDLSTGFSNLWNRFAISGAARAFTTDGYYIVPANMRGAADDQANVEFVTGDIRVDHYTSIGDFFFKTSHSRRAASERHGNHTQFHRPGNRLAALRARVHQRFPFRCWASTRGTTSTPRSIA